MNWIRQCFQKHTPYWRLKGGALGLDWSAMKVDSNGLEYFDLGNVRLYPWTWNPIMDVFENGVLVEENIQHNHPKYGRELYRRYLLPGRFNNIFPEDRGLIETR